MLLVNCSQPTLTKIEIHTVLHSVLAAFTKIPNFSSKLKDFLYKFKGLSVNSRFWKINLPKFVGKRLKTLSEMQMISSFLP